MSDIGADTQALIRQLFDCRANCTRLEKDMYNLQLERSKASSEQMSMEQKLEE